MDSLSGYSVSHTVYHSELTIMNKQLVERMYWAHGYNVEDIAQRLNIGLELVKAIVAKDYIETSVWDEDTGTYRQEQTQRTQAQERPRVIIPSAQDKDTMKKQTANQVYSVEPSTRATKTPLHSSDDKTMMIRQQLERIAQSATGIQTPLHAAQYTNVEYQGPAARLREWLEFTAVITGLALWITYWYGLHAKGIL